jgi:hypothetical protein
MRPLIPALLLCAGATACSGSPYEPATVLPVEFTVTEQAESAPTATIDNVGDQVIGTIVRPNVCGYLNGASATLDHGSLNMTVTLISQGPVPCHFVTGSLLYQIVVHGAPSGANDVALHFRIVVGAIATDSTVARQRLSLP